MSWPVRTIRFVLYLVLFVTPIFFLPNTSELFEFNKMVITYFFTAVIATAWAVQIVLERKFIFRHTSLDWPILIFLASQAVSLLFSIDQRTSLMGYYSRFNGGLLSLSCYSLLYWAWVTFMDKRSTRTAISVSLWALVLVSLWGILEHFGIDASLWVQDVQNRIFSTMGQPNWLAAYIVSFIYLSFVTPLTKSGWSRYLTPVILILTLLFTKSRSGLLAFGLSNLVFWWQVFTLKLPEVKSVFRPLSIIAGLGLLFTLAFSNPIRDLFISPEPAATGKTTGPALEVGGTESGAIRKIVWTGAIKAWLSSPKTILIGSGPETFTMAYYQNRPVGHNSTSEWDLLYNKAHNEFLNYLATTGLVGLISYLLLLFFMLRQLFIFRIVPVPSGKPPRQTVLTLTGVAFLAGWLTIPVTDFWGFSVVVVQILMFLLPAMSWSLHREEIPETEYHLPLTSGQILLFLAVVAAGGFLLFSTFKYWLADIKYAAGEYQVKAFRSTEDPNYILQAYDSLHEAFDLNSTDPVIASDLSLVTAYMSILTSDSDATGSAQLADTALGLSQRAISQSPHHPNYYKSASRTAMLLSTLDPAKMDLAISYLEQAREISPTDPVIPFNLGVIYSYLGNTPKAVTELENALRLKPDYADAREQLQTLATASAQPAR